MYSYKQTKKKEKKKRTNEKKTKENQPRRGLPPPVPTSEFTFFSITASGGANKKNSNVFCTSARPGVFFPLRGLPTGSHTHTHTPCSHFPMTVRFSLPQKSQVSCVCCVHQECILSGERRWAFHTEALGLEGGKCGGPRPSSHNKQKPNKKGNHASMQHARDMGFSFRKTFS